MNLEAISRREAFLASQRDLRERLTKNLKLLQIEKMKLVDEKRALEVEIGKLEAELFNAPLYSGRYWHLLGSINVAQKRLTVGIPADDRQLRELALSLGPLIKQASVDVPKFKEQFL